jgi:lysophospholipid acyltransferase (LPLAT)-like uncharacterized protein
LNESTLTSGQRRKAALIAGVASPVIAALGATWRWRVDGLHHYDAVIASGHQPIMAFWHGRILPGTVFFRDRGIVVITSENFDGEWIARIIQRFGYGTARGSSSRGGIRALVQLRHDLGDGRPVAFTLDGPRGPARVAQPGAVWLAGATGHPVLPFHIEADRSWTIRSWDKTQVPKPFSHVAVVLGEPLFVEGTSDAVVERSVTGLEGALRKLEARAVDMLNQRAPQQA